MGAHATHSWAVFSYPRIFIVSWGVPPRGITVPDGSTRALPPGITWRNWGGGYPRTQTSVPLTHCYFRLYHTWASRPHFHSLAHVETVPTQVPDSASSARCLATRSVNFARRRIPLMPSSVRSGKILCNSTFMLVHHPPPPQGQLGLTHGHII